MINEVGSWKSEVGSRVDAVPPCDAAQLPLRTSHFRIRRQAFTLIELLVSIAILSILAALLLGVAAVASETAREARTKALVTRLHTLLMERYDGYRSRRVELSSVASTDSVYLRNALFERGGIYTQQYNQGDPRAIAAARLAGVRELMKLEMPDRWSDITGWNQGGVAGWPTAAAPIPDPTTPPGNQAPIVTTGEVRSRLWFLGTTPTLNSVYLRQYNKAAAAGVTMENLLANQGAECLYLTIMYATSDGEARSLFKQDDIADTDGDGIPEFVDGWGRPISFLRWAPGFASDAQLSVSSVVELQQDGGASAIVNAIVEDHDPSDLFQIDVPTAFQFSSEDPVEIARGWRLVPLIVSSGGDEEFGLRFDNNSGANDWVGGVDPYADVLPSVNGKQTFGEQTDDEAYADNINNHEAGSLSRSQ